MNLIEIIVPGEERASYSDTGIARFGFALPARRVVRLAGGDTRPASMSQDVAMARKSSEWIGQTLSQGRYLVRAKLGEGGMGLVYRALDRNLDADVVIKAPRRAMLEDPEFAARFAREIRSLVRLTHPCIVKISDVGEHDGVPFAVMQYLSGGSLEDYRAATSAGALANLASLADWLPGVAQALDFVHKQGYVHRDVKPGNILFDAHGNAFLSDFGVAKVLGSSAESSRSQTAHTGTGLVVGTPEYMAPELIRAKPFDGRVDQYALAITVYEMLLGRRPFVSTSATAILVMHTSDDPVPLTEAQPRIARGISDAVGRGLVKDPSGRYPNCAAFAQAVVAAAAASPIAPADLPKSPSGKPLRPDQVRLPCPSCQKSLVLPAALFQDLEKARAKKLACPSCQARVRISGDGKSLVVSEGGETGAFTPQPRPQGTVKEVIPDFSRAAGTVKEAIPGGNRPAGTVKEVAPGANRPAATVKEAALDAAPWMLINTDAPAPNPASPRTMVERVQAEDDRDASAATVPKGVPAWMVGAGLTAGVLVSALFFFVFMSGGSSASKPNETTNLAKSDAKLPPVAPTKPTADTEKPKDASPPHPTEVALAKTSGSSSTAPTLESAPEPEPAPKPKESIPIAPPPRSKQETPSTSVARTESPPPGPVEFEPITDIHGPENDVSIAKLMDNPREYSQQVVTTEGVFLLGKGAQHLPNDTVAVTVAQTRLHFESIKKYGVPSGAADPRNVIIDPLLAQRLEAAKLLTIVRNATPRHAVNFIETVAALTFHVMRIHGTENIWVPVLVRIEFLLDLNLARISSKQFGGSFLTATVTASGNRTALSHSKWSDRLGVPYITAITRVANQIKRMYQDAQSQQIDAMVGRGTAAASANYQDNAKLLGDQLRRTTMGR